MMTQSAFALLRMQYPEINLGEIDAKIGKWRDVIGNNNSFAYEIGRMLVAEPPQVNGGIITFAPDIARAIRELRDG